MRAATLARADVLLSTKKFLSVPVTRPDTPSVNVGILFQFSSVQGVTGRVLALKNLSYQLESKLPSVV